MSTTKHPRKSGATTVKKNGKIVGNIGAGKTPPQTVRNVEERQLLTSVSDNKTSPQSTLDSAQQKFSTLSQKSISFEQAQTLWNLTSDKNLVERLNILSNYIESMDLDDRNKMLSEIEGNAAISRKRSGVLGRADSSEREFVSILAGRSSDGNINPNIVEAFAQHTFQYPNFYWKSIVAQNELLSPQTLDTLSNYEDAMVWESIIKNSNTETETITKIYNKARRKHYELTVGIIAINPKTSQEILKKLSRRSMWRKNVARNVGASSEILSYLAKRHEPLVVARNRNAPPEALERLSKSHDENILCRVAIHPNATQSTLERLSKNSNREVARAAQKNLASRINLLYGKSKEM